MSSNKEINDHMQLVKNLLSFKSEIIGELSKHNLGMNTADVLEKLNLCLFDNYPKKK